MAKRTKKSPIEQMKLCMVKKCLERMFVKLGMEPHCRRLLRPSANAGGARIDCKRLSPRKEQAVQLVRF
jgi:hypothetical protein